jgi:hypothetical protein
MSKKFQVMDSDSEFVAFRWGRFGPNGALSFEVVAAFLLERLTIEGGDKSPQSKQRGR